MLYQDCVRSSLLCLCCGQWKRPVWHESLKTFAILSTAYWTAVVFHSEKKSKLHVKCPKYHFKANPPTCHTASLLTAEYLQLTLTPLFNIVAIDSRFPVLAAYSSICFSSTNSIQKYESSAQKIYMPKHHVSWVTFRKPQAKHTFFVVVWKVVCLVVNTTRFLQDKTNHHVLILQLHNLHI